MVKKVSNTDVCSNISPAGTLHGRTYTKADIHATSRPQDQNLQGFETHYGNITDYILRCTYKIWEQKNIGLIYTHYAEKGEIYTPLGYMEKVEDVVDGTINTLSGFPNRQLYSLNVIWGGDEKQGYYSSHLIRSVMKNSGRTIFGAATEKQIDVHTIADCVCKDNLIIKEWLVRDNGDYIKQLGFDIQNIALSMAQKDFDAGVIHWFEQECNNRIASKRDLPQILGRPDFSNFTNDIAEQITANMLKDVWEARNYKMIDDYYSYNVEIHAAGGRSLCGTPNLKNLISVIQSSFIRPDFKIEHIQSIDSDAGENEKFVHVRWSMCGLHTTGEFLDEGTKAPLHVLGISQFRLVRGRIAEEWMVFDELALWKQIKLHQLRTGQISVDTQKT